MAKNTFRRGQHIREYSRNKIMLICSLRCDLSSYGLYNTNKQTVNVDIKIKESKIILCTQLKTLKSRDVLNYIPQYSLFKRKAKLSFEQNGTSRQ